MVLDVLKPLGHKKILENELEGYGIRLNQKPPRITFRKKEKGGLSISSTVRARGGTNWRRRAQGLKPPDTPSCVAPLCRCR